MTPEERKIFETEARTCQINGLNRLLDEFKEWLKKKRESENQQNHA